MIVRMKHLDLVCLASDREATLERLRKLGVMHLDFTAATGASVQAARGEAADAERAVRLIVKARTSFVDPIDARPREIAEVLALDADREKLKSAREELQRDVRACEPYGDFDPKLAQRLLDAGVDVSSVAELPSPLPAMRLSKMREKLARVENRIALDTARIAGCDPGSILALYPMLADKIAFEQATELMKSEGAVAVISGWIPENRVNEVREGAYRAGWGALLRDPAEGETPPTLVEPPKMFRPMKVLFSALGISPAYTEADVSVPFLCYFSLFFAMLVGDGAYGTILLLATLWGWRKYRAIAVSVRNPVVKSWLVLSTVFSCATIAWGLLSNTWFGVGLPFAKDWPTVKWLADPSYNNMMFLCFTIGVSHLMIARIWSGLCKLNDSTCVAEFGWAGILLFMYFVTNTIVGIFPAIPTAMYWVFGLALVAVFGFTLKPSEFRTRGAELGMLPLSLMSTLGDIISYVRLFAVGLASIKVAENFNEMATALVANAPSVWVKALMAVLMVLILFFGHVLNLAMAGLSILVHAVRLNTLEFSNHKGVTWSGYAFSPFRKKSH